MQDPYCYPDTNILRNKYDIMDADKLRDAERDFTVVRNQELLRKIINGNFDLKHLQAIHKFLFQDIYDWAGQIRTVDIAKGNLFCRAFLITNQADIIFGELAKENYLQNTPVDKFPARLAYYLAEINALHPFREGNGRSQREFIRQLAHLNGYFLAYDGVTKDEMTSASIASFSGDYRPMEELMARCLRRL